MSDLYSMYLLEKEQKATLEIKDKGFVVYKIVKAEGKDLCHICVMYIHPAYRTGQTARLLLEALKDKFKSQCKAFTASIHLQQINPTATMKILLFFGFEIVNMINDEVLLYKEFGDLDGRK